MGSPQLQIMRRTKIVAVDAALRSAEISRRSLAESYRKHVEPLKPGELNARLYLWTLRQGAKKSLVVTTVYLAAAASWFALKS